jgi:hypothetical protein
MAAQAIRKNIYSGYCLRCHKWVPQGAGMVERDSAGRWFLYHLPGICTPSGAAPRLVSAQDSREWSVPPARRTPTQATNTHCEECGAAVPNGRRCPVCGETEMLRHSA